MVGISASQARIRSIDSLKISSTHLDSQHSQSPPSHSIDRIESHPEEKFSCLWLLFKPFIAFWRLICRFFANKEVKDSSSGNRKDLEELQNLADELFSCQNREKTILEHMQRLLEESASSEDLVDAFRELSNQCRDTLKKFFLSDEDISDLHQLIQQDGIEILFERYFTYSPEQKEMIQDTLTFFIDEKFSSSIDSEEEINLSDVKELAQKIVHNDQYYPLFYKYGENIISQKSEEIIDSRKLNLYSDLENLFDDYKINSDNFLILKNEMASAWLLYIDEKSRKLDTSPYYCLAVEIVKDQKKLAFFKEHGGCLVDSNWKLDQVNGENQSLCQEIREALLKAEIVTPEDYECFKFFLAIEEAEGNITPRSRSASSDLSLSKLKQDPLAKKRS